MDTARPRRNQRSAEVEAQHVGDVPAENRPPAPQEKTLPGPLATRRKSLIEVQNFTVSLPNSPIFSRSSTGSNTAVHFCAPKMKFCGAAAAKREVRGARRRAQGATCRARSGKRRFRGRKIDGRKMGFMWRRARRRRSTTSTTKTSGETLKRRKAEEVKREHWSKIGPNWEFWPDFPVGP